MTPLAHLLRPTTLEHFIGQEKLVGNGQPLHQLYKQGQISSMIFWGPPGVGKTTLAKILATNAKRPWHELSAVSAGKKDIRAIIEAAAAPQQPLTNTTLQKPVLFLDEIHRFNKAQQDFLLPYVEQGELVLIGATTENPSFEVNSALLSRLQVHVLSTLDEAALTVLISRAIKHLELREEQKIKLNQDAHELLIQFANGDGRKLLGLIETTWNTYHQISAASIKKSITSLPISYDKQGENHYDTISAFIKSMRASNVDAALYYLARMTTAGEDPVFIARRMVVFASEDVGLAQPTALVVANAVFDAVKNIGYPEAEISLAHGVAYLCQAQKNRVAYDAYFAAKADVEHYGNLPIPLELRNAPTSLMKKLGYGRNYSMYPDKSHSLLPESIHHKRYFVKSKENPGK